MIRVTVELLSARTGERTILGVMDICNKGNRPFGDKRGDYEGHLYRKGPFSGKNRYGNVLKRAEVLDFPRKSYPIWRLIHRMLGTMHPEWK